MSAKRIASLKQAGMVSILVTMLLMIVISLIVLGFANIARLNSRNALDRQLSTQAFYAAEAGINDVRYLIDQAVAGGSPLYNKDDCTNGTGAAGAFYSQLPNSTLDANNQVSYSCVMVNPTPPDLQYKVGTTSTVVPLNSTGGNIGQLTLTWQPAEPTDTPINGCPASLSNVFSASNDWDCGYGVLRIDLVPTAGSGLNADILRNTTMTSFLVPTNSAFPLEYNYAAGSANNAKLVPCDNSPQCKVTIKGLNSTQYYMRIVSLYKDSQFQVSAADAASNPLNLQGAQVVVDSTGKAQDVLRRLQVRIPLTSSSTNLLSDYALMTTDSICKRFASMDTYFKSDAKHQVPTMSSGNPFCQ